jgi:hypothetical protein
LAFACLSPESQSRAHRRAQSRPGLARRRRSPARLAGSLGAQLAG